MKMWGPKSDGELRRLFQHGDTCEEMARILGTSKGSIVGRLHRLNLYRSHRQPKAEAKAIAMVPDRPKPKAPLTAPLGQPAELLRLDPDGCKWAVSAHLARVHTFCNSHRYAGFAYCYKHYCRSIGKIGYERQDVTGSMSSGSPPV